MDPKIRLLGKRYWLARVYFNIQKIVAMVPQLKTGIMAAENEIIVIIDADGTYPVDQIPELVEKMSNADMVVGARTGKDVHIPFYATARQVVFTMAGNLDSGTANSRPQFWPPCVSERMY